MKLHRIHVWLACALFVISLLIYQKALLNGYTLDDVMIVEQNPLLENDASVLKIFRSPYWDREKFPERGLYRPLTILSFKLSNDFFGEFALIINHALNMLGHASVATLLFFLLIRLQALPWPAFILALSYAVHPVHTEVVASLVGRGDIMACLFTLIAVHLSSRVQ